LAVPLRTGYEDARYIIYERHGAYYAKDGETGDIVYGGPNNAGGVSGSNAAAVIQAALNALTSGRTWKEKVVLKGNFPLSAPITAVSYLSLHIHGKLALLNGVADGLNKNMFQSLASSGSHLDVVGGVWDGNKSHQTAGGAAIALENWTDVRIDGIVVLNAGYNVSGIICTNCERLVIENVKVTGSGVTDGAGIDLFNCTDVSVNKAYSSENFTDGLYIGTPATPSRRISVTDSKLYSNGRNGLQVDLSTWITVIGSRFMNNQVYGARFSSARIFSLVGCTLADDQAVPTQDYGLVVEKVGAYQAPSDFIVEGCTFWGNVTFPATFYLPEEPYNVRNNSGYVTENRGIAVMDGGGLITVSYKMSEIPVVINVTAQADLGDVWVPAGTINAVGFTLQCDAPVAGVSVFWNAYAKYAGTYW